MQIERFPLFTQKRYHKTAKGTQRGLRWRPRRFSLDAVEDRRLLSGTPELMDIAKVPADGRLHEFVVAGDTPYCGGNGGVTGDELWKSDGTTAGTIAVKDIVSGFESSGPSELTAAGARVFFQASGSLYVSDGTESGTERMIGEPESISVRSDMRWISGSLYFRAFDDVHGFELWTIVGTKSGTHLVADVNPGPNGSGSSVIGSINGHVAFAADDGVHGREVWKIPANPVIEDTTEPTATITPPVLSLPQDTIDAVEVDFSEPVEHVDLADFTLTRNGGPCVVSLWLTMTRSMLPSHSPFRRQSSSQRQHRT